MPDSASEPIVLEVANLPREQIGPFLLLGVDKDASNAEIEAHWAQRLIWARAKQIRVPLEDLNWAKEVLLDRDKRVLADAQSLNPDTAPGELRELMARHGPLEPEAATWTPRESPLPDLPDPPPNLMPDIDALRAALTMPDLPLEMPAADRILEKIIAAELDPWAL